jgi:hypothetical protein
MKTIGLRMFLVVTLFVALTHHTLADITCPDDITTGNDPGDCSAVVNYTVPDPETGDAVACDPPSGSTFPVGTTQVTCTETLEGDFVSSCTFDVTVNDTQAPVATCPADITVDNDEGECGAVVNFVAEVTDNCPGAEIVCDPPSGSTFPVGATQVTCTATDDAGNTSACMFSVTVNDTQKPIATCPADITVGNDEGECGAVVNFMAGVADNCPGAEIVCDPPSGSTFPVGTTQVTCTATDDAGNTDVCIFSVTVNDTENPVATCPADITVDNDEGQCGAVVNFMAGVADNCPGAEIVCEPASGSTFPVGTTQVTCTATDDDGNTSACMFSVTVNDTQAPVATCPADITVDNDEGQCGAVVNFVAGVTDNCPDAGIVCDPPSGSTFPVGTTQVTCTATDDDGNTSACMFSVTVNDTENPVATCPADITVGNDAGECGAVVNFMAGVADNCPGAEIVCDPPSGSTFPVGTTQVTCTATDDAGNTDVCMFSVTVNDTEAPVVTCPANITVNNTPGACSAVVNYEGQSALDNCDGELTPTCEPESGSSFPVGMTVVTCSATDAAGNTGSCMFTVTVNDAQLPTISCPADLMVGTDEGECSAVVNYDPPVFDDNCPDVTVACDPPAGSTFPVGTTTVTCTATDAADNTADCTFDVTVADTEPPMIACPADIAVAAPTDAFFVMVEYDDPTVSDNCPGAMFACEPPSGSNFLLGTTTVTCTATDEAGHTASCTFTVFVEGDFTELVVISPNGGEVACSGGTFTIRWGAPPELEFFDLFYSLNGGATWVPIATGLPNSGPVNEFEWNVPTPRNNRPNSLIRVVGYNDIVQEDISDEPFTVEVVRLTRPNGGETFIRGTIEPITWEIKGTAEPLHRIVLFYSLDCGQTWIRIAGMRANRGQFNWIVPDPGRFQNNEVLVRILLQAERRRASVSGGGGVVDGDGVRQPRSRRLGVDISDEKFTIRRRPLPSED